MANCNKTIAGLLTLSVLGLFSCSSDKAQDDGWRLSEPRIESREAGLNAPVRQSPIQNLPADSVLVFNPDDLDGGGVEVQSTCHSPDGIVKETRSFRKQTSFEIKSLWPKELWSKLSNEELIQTSCDFKLAVSHGNVVHDFTLAATRLNSFLRTEMTAKVRNATATRKLDSEEQANLLASELSQAFPAEGTLSFVCDSFQSSMPATDASAVSAQATRTNEAGTARSLNLKPLLFQAWNLKRGPDPRETNPTQDCHFVKSADDRSFEISPTFKYQFAPKPLTITAKSGMSEAHAGNWRNLNIFSLNVKNESAVPAAFALPAQFGNVRLRLVGRHMHQAFGLPYPLGSLILGSRIVLEPLQPFSSKAPLRANQDEQIFMLEPGEEIELGASLNSSANCYADASADPNTFLSSRNMGLLYGFEKKIRLTQFKDWSAAISEMQGERVELAGEDVFPQTISAPTRFEPSQAYLKTIGAVPLPPILPEYPSHHTFGYVSMKKGKPVYEGPGNFCFFDRLTFQQPEGIAQISGGMSMKMKFHPIDVP